MLKYIIKRILILIPILIGISFIVQLLLMITPGDPARIMAGASAEEWEYEQIRIDLGLDKPLLERYWNFISNAMRGDLGRSFHTKRPVFQDTMQRFPYTLLLATLSVGLAVLIGIPLGVFAATNQYTIKDNLAILASLICVSMPSFWFALLLVQRFSVDWRLLPVAGITTWQGWVLPTVSLSLGYAASISRQMRSNMLEVVKQDYIVTARAKGQTERKVIYRHALKNALIPVVQTIGGIYGMALGGAIIAEMIFSIPGLGNYTLSALTNRDYPVIQGSVFILSTIFCLVVLLIDIAFAFIDPRIRSQYIRKTKRVVKGVADNG